MKQNFIGRYRIVEMELWDKDYIDMVVPGFIEIKKDGYAEFQFGCVSGGGQYSYTKDGKYVDFDWEGEDECDEDSGEFQLEINEDKMTGSVSFENGEESELTAIREK